MLYNTLLVNDLWRRGKSNPCPNIVVNEGGFDSAVKSFFDIELTIREELISLIERYDYIYYPQFADIFLEFIQVSLSYNIRTSILEDSKRISQGKAVAVFFHEYLDKYGNEFYQNYLSGTEGGGNIMHPYAFLCDLMKKERTIIISYQNEIDKLFGKHNYFIIIQLVFYFTLKLIFFTPKLNSSKNAPPGALYQYSGDLPKCLYTRVLQNKKSFFVFQCLKFFNEIISSLLSENSLGNFSLKINAPLLT